MRTQRLASLVATSIVCVLAFESDAQTTTIKLNGGMEARINWVGRNKALTQATVSMTLANKGKNTVHLLLIGPVAAQDNTGGHYRYEKVSGISSCTWASSWPDKCLADATKVQLIQSYVQVDPGTDITVNFALRGDRTSKGPVMSFSSVFAARIVSDPIRDTTLSDEQKAKETRSMSVSFSSIAVTDAQ